MTNHNALRSSHGAKKTPPAHKMPQMLTAEAEEYDDFFDLFKFAICERKIATKDLDSKAY